MGIAAAAASTSLYRVYVLNPVYHYTITMPYYSIDVDSLPLLGCIKINQFIETEKRKQMKS